MKKPILLLLISFFFLSSCEKPEQLCSTIDLVETTITNPEEYLIIDALMDSNYDNVDFIHISQESHSMTDTSIFEAYFKNIELEIDADKIEEYILLNSMSHVWGEAFDTPRQLISEEELDCIFDSQANGWMAYYDKYENSVAYLNLGRPVIDENRAMLTYVYHCGYLCDSGYTVTLKKENNVWVLDKQYIIWIS